MKACGSNEDKINKNVSFISESKENSEEDIDRQENNLNKNINRYLFNKIKESLYKKQFNIDKYDKILKNTHRISV